MTRIAQALAPFLLRAITAAALLPACRPAAHAASRGIVSPAAAAVVVQRDITYGSDPAERLDVYRQPGLHEAPVVIIVHGGAYMFGDKAAIPFPTVARFLAAHGMVVASINYRLAPAADWPGAIQDVARATAFMHDAAPGYGGDPRHIVLLGHSAGATDVAGYVLDRRFQPDTGPGIAAAILVSGRYTLVPDRRDPNEERWETYFGTDPTLWHDRAPIDHVAHSPHVPLMLVIAQSDNLGLDVGGLALRDALCRRARRCPAFLRVDGATHSSEMARAAVEGSPFSVEMLRFIGHGRG